MIMAPDTEERLAWIGKHQNEGDYLTFQLHIFHAFPHLKPHLV